MKHFRWPHPRLYKIAGERARRILAPVFLWVRKATHMVGKWPRPIRLSLLAALVIATGIIIGLYERHQMYTITADELRLVHASTVDQKFVTDKDNVIAYNRQTETNASQAKKAILAASQYDATGKTPYRAELSKKAARTVSFSDAEGERKLKLIPQFSAGQASYQNGMVMYPIGQNQKQVYTFRTNGLKEDIVLSAAPSSEVHYTWKLDTGDGLEARLMPNGAVGIYSANPNLFGNIQASDSKSQQLLDKARKAAAKDYLVYEMPAPYITDANGEMNNSDVTFSLHGDVLTLTAKNLEHKTYPLSIDPTIVVTTTSDFKQGTDDGMINYASPDEIQRAGISGGSVGATTQQSNAFTTPRANHTSVVWNSYLYIVGGSNNSGTYYNDIQHCPINSDGSIGTCTDQTNAFTTARSGHTSVVYNGYLYIVGGFTPSRLNDIQHCPINLDGSVGTCVQQTSAFTTARDSHASTVYNGYLYIVGGESGSGLMNDVQHCPINGDGSIGTCVQQTNVFTTGRYGLTSAIYNGYLYIVGGYNNGVLGDIQYCVVNSDGSIGACVQQASAFTTARYGHTSIILNGYLYIIGGNNGSTLLNDLQYCPINANGSIGACVQQASAFTTTRFGHTSVTSGGYIYVIGGVNTSGVPLNDIQRLPISASAPTGTGSVGATTRQTNAFTTARYNHSSVIWNGYLYIIGGDSFSSGEQNDIIHCPINGDGSVGSCVQQTSAFTTARERQTAVVNNGYLYIIGGGDGGATFYNDIQYCALNPSTGAAGACTQQTNAFTGARDAHSSAVYNGYLYIIGGEDSGGGLNDIQHCLFNSDGSIGTCVDQSGALNSPLFGQSAVIWNGYLYVVGGYSDAVANTVNDIEYCPINTNGSVGTCTTQSAAFTGDRQYLSAAVYSGYLYIADNQAQQSKNDIIHCPFNANGSVGTCVQQTSAFTTARFSLTGGIYNNYLYLIGGYNGGTFQNDIQHLSISIPVQSTFGGVGSNTQQANILPTVRYGQSSVVWNGYLYNVGGYNVSTSTFYNDIQYCPLNSDGSVGTCTDQTSAFVNGRYSHATAVWNGYIYIIGGNNGSSTNDVIRCPLNAATHAVGSCTTQTNAFTTDRMDLSAMIYNNLLYIIGGYSISGGSALNDIQYCVMNAATHAVGSCTDQTNAFTTARRALSAVIYNGYLYISGGSNGTTELNDIQYCPIDLVSGAAGACTQQAAAFTGIRAGHTSLAYNGYLYIIGGNTNSTYYADIQYCPINANGSVDACTRQTSAFATGRYEHSSVVANGYLYVIGGNSGGSSQKDLQYLPVNAPMMLGTYDKTISFSGLKNINTLSYSGQADCGLTINYATAGSNGIYGAVTTISGAAPSTSYSISQTNIQYVRLSFILDDSSCGGVSTVSDVSLTYAGPPDAPTLVSPASNANGISLLPVFTLKTTDDPTYVRYKIDVCSVSNCSSILRTIDETASQTGWSGQDAQTSTAYNVSTTLSASTLATHTYQAPALSIGTQYWWRAYAIDPGDTNTWGPASAIQSFTTQGAPSAPTLINPIGGVQASGLAPIFTLRTTDPNGDVLQYKIEVCNTSNCSSVLRTIDQTVSQTGWSGQDASGGTAYVGSTTLSSSTIASHSYQAPNLAAGTQYWWRAYAIDPSGSNTWSSASSIATFMTPTNVLDIQGGTKILGGTHLGN
jgi:hypothetical protein